MFAPLQSVRENPPMFYSSWINFQIPFRKKSMELACQKDFLLSSPQSRESMQLFIKPVLGFISINKELSVYNTFLVALQWCSLGKKKKCAEKSLMHNAMQGIEPLHWILLSNTEKKENRSQTYRILEYHFFTNFSCFLFFQVGQAYYFLARYGVPS